MLIIKLIQVQLLSVIKNRMETRFYTEEQKRFNL